MLQYTKWCIISEVWRSINSKSTVHCNNNAFGHIKDILKLLLAGFNLLILAAETQRPSTATVNRRGDADWHVSDKTTTPTLPFWTQTLTLVLVKKTEVKEQKQPKQRCSSEARCGNMFRFFFFLLQIMTRHPTKHSVDSNTRHFQSSQGRR